MSALDASYLSPLVNGFSILKGSPNSIVVPDATKLTPLRDVTVTGTLLPKQLVYLDPTTNGRKPKPSKQGYHIEAGDGDLHFCLGTKPGTPHIACELQRATPWLNTFKQALNQTITVSGFFRCLFEHPGFRKNDDAHIFEIHPVRAVDLGDGIQTFDVDLPDQTSIHEWVGNIDLNVQDGRMGVEYDEGQDTLTFAGMAGRDENYVTVTGDVNNLNLNPARGEPSSFTLDNGSIGHSVNVLCLQGTSAARQLGNLGEGSSVNMVGLRNIDLQEARNGQYTINLLAIDIQVA